jgi:histidinol-phosphate phosphatase family protein
VTGHRAAFLDRDGTIIDDIGYLSDPAKVRLRPEVAAGIAALRAADFRIIVVTNQSGIARGTISLAEYHAVADRVGSLLRDAGAPLDATYMCPHHPDVTGPCPCRKPGLRLYQDAARDWGIALSKSIWIGNQPRDVEPALALGGRGYLVAAPETEVPPGVERAANLAEAARRAIGR